MACAIEHEESSGMGVGRRLLGELVQWARQTGTKVVPPCPFAKARFAKDPSLRDVLVRARRASPPGQPGKASRA